MVHSQQDLEMAQEASNILFGKSTKESLLKLDEQTLLDVFAGVPHFEVEKTSVIGKPLIEVLTADAAVFASKGEMRKLTQGGGVSINKEKLSDANNVVCEADFLDGKYLLAQQGKKKYFLIIAK